LHNDKDQQILFVSGPNTCTTNPRWRTAAILKKLKNCHVSATVRPIGAKFYLRYMPQRPQDTIRPPTVMVYLNICAVWTYRTQILQQRSKYGLMKNATEFMRRTTTSVPAGEKTLLINNYCSPSNQNIQFMFIFIQSV